jgi:peptidoglycan-N-acetylglucosamine deacetylase
MNALASLSVDLDSLEHYCHIHGRSTSILNAEAHALVATKAIPRFLELFERVGARATFFVIGQDTTSNALCDALRTAARAGIELASHSHSHSYVLSRWNVDAIVNDLTAAHTRIEALCGVAPVGFRAPGYTLSSALLEAVVRLGYRYDSSTFAAVPYYLAKAAILQTLTLSGRPSRAILDSPSVLLAPRTPYRPAAENPYRRGHLNLLELPIAVTPLTRVPFIGTLVTQIPVAASLLALRGLHRDTLVNFEMHAVDVLDTTDGIPETLAARQRDLKVPASLKMKRLRAVFSQLMDTRKVVPLREAAAMVEV